MVPSSISLLLLFILIALIASTSANTCTTQTLTDASNNNKVYANCMDLPHLNAFLHWTHNTSNSSVSVAFVATPPRPGGWVSWAVNPTGTGMVGAQSFVAYKGDNGVVTVFPLNIQSYSKMSQNLTIDTWNLRGEEDEGIIKIFVNIKVVENAVSLNQVWQVGPSVTAGRIDPHAFAPENLNSKGPLSLVGTQSISHGVDSRTKRKNIHGILNAVSWGFLFPLGVAIARYLRIFPCADPTWFYLHVGCQMSAYVIGVVGWVTGLKLGSESEGIVYTAHRNIGIALFCLCTIQMFALLVRPNKDHKYRVFWNIYHHSFGYTIIFLGIINVFKGFDILSTTEKWKSSYIVAISALAITALILEVITWIVVLRRKSNTK
ncbi:hypothetical protein HN51_069907 [Arachis hypogaea]|uniref:Cytochrome b561 and DOMON domain-containing protein n=1 Tax=Arachis hypogaea TaxID=3818 RepID=A0A444Z400_ARAHY|nr:cytochrome b561 and DOMON domain-containing protein At3g25290-like [Arachis ipaensis]XP_025652656.1 cytochrome b561 and DOMON domain-containing protein At3g25290-like [Arachis hypogaea]RYR08937.1 hypothetical protein Ahy_B05g076842 [Arachis hypogaea]